MTASGGMHRNVRLCLVSTKVMWFIIGVNAHVCMFTINIASILCEDGCVAACTALHYHDHSITRSRPTSQRAAGCSLSSFPHRAVRLRTRQKSTSDGAEGLPGYICELGGEDQTMMN